MLSASDGKTSPGPQVTSPPQAPTLLAIEWQSTPLSQKATTKEKGLDMICYFGTRWIPFEKEIKNCSAPAKSYGIHGVPWTKDSSGWHEDCSTLGKTASDGCIRLKTGDVEELYAIISTRPLTTTIEITTYFAKADLRP